eukprot:448958-Hanusia_phi.AAC.2
MFTGPIILALPITVISTTFAEAYEDEEFKNVRCSCFSPLLLTQSAKLSKTGLNIQGEQLKKRGQTPSGVPLAR